MQYVQNQLVRTWSNSLFKYRLVRIVFEQMGLATVCGTFLYIFKLDACASIGSFIVLEACMEREAWNERNSIYSGRSLLDFFTGREPDPLLSWSTWLGFNRDASPGRFPGTVLDAFQFCYVATCRHIYICNAFMRCSSSNFSKKNKKFPEADASWQKKHGKCGKMTSMDRAPTGWGRKKEFPRHTWLLVSFRILCHAR